MRVERVRVGDVLRLERLPVEPMLDDEYVSIGIRSFGKGIFHYEAKTGDRLGSLRFFELRPERLVISNIKGWEGAIAVSDDSDTDCIASNRFLSYVPVDDRIDVRWARWFFLSEPGIELIQRASPGSADRNRTLAIERFEALEIPLPPLDEQQHAASRLDRLSERSARAGAKQGHARTLRAALRASLVAGLGRPMGGATGWQRRPLSEVLTLSTQEVVVQPMDEYRIAGVYRVGRGLIDRGSIRGSETSYKMLNRLRPDDVVVSKLNGWEGAVAVVNERFAGAHVSPEYPTFTIDQDQLAPSFFRGIATSPWFWEQLLGTTRGSMVRRKRVSAADVLGTTVLVPPIEEQRALGRSLDAIDRAAVYSDDLAPRLAALVPAALNEAFGGLR